MLASNREERACLLIDLETGVVINKIVTPSDSAVIGASEDGAWLIVGTQDVNNFRVSAMHPSERIVILDERKDVIFYNFNSSSFNPVQQLVAVACEPHTTKVLSTQTGELLYEFKGHLNGAKIVKFTPDGSRLITAVAGDDAFKFWETRENRPLQLLTLKVDAMFRADIHFSPDGNSMSSSDKLGNIHIWRAPSWEEIEAMEAEAND